MLSLRVIFWLMILFFAMVGYLRGWPKEVIALSGLIASIALLTHFGDSLVALVGASGGAGLDPLGAQRQQFWIQAGFHLIIAFFSYQGVTHFAGQIASGRFAERLRSGLELRLLGAVVGAINGYLLVGGLWSFLEYEMTPLGYVPLPPGQPYPFDPGIISRPIGEAATLLMTSFLPVGFLSPTAWLLLFFLAFFLVIVALV